MSVTMLDLNGDQATYNPEPPPPLPRIWIGFVLAFACLVTEIFAVAGGAVEGTQGAESFAVLSVLVTIICWIYWLFCVHRFHRILNQIAPYVGGQSTYPITPGRAVGRHFIPFFNLFWVFKWPLEISRFVRENSPVSMMSGGVLGLFLLLGLLLARLEGFLGFCCLFSVGLYISTKLRRLVAEHERVRMAAETFT
ncbi:MAG TPA: hypothetical protein VGP73_09875 [Thermoanaerobaculia bacterium]